MTLSEAVIVMGSLELVALLAILAVLAGTRARPIRLDLGRRAGKEARAGVREAA
jgi:hypothetical protein